MDWTEKADHIIKKMKRDGDPFHNMNTDGASPRKVMLQLLICADSWGPEARIIGNIQAADIKRMCEHYLSGDDK